MTRVGYRVPELGERVQMGKYATAFRGVWGQVIKVDHNPPQAHGKGILARSRVPGVPGADGGTDHTEVYIAAFYPGTKRPLFHNGKLVVIKASPYELDGGLLDDRPIWKTGNSRKQRNFRP